MVLSKDKRVFVRLGLHRHAEADQRAVRHHPGHSARRAIRRKLLRLLREDEAHYQMVWWDGNGFCLWLKRLERDSFPGPRLGTNSTR